MKIALVNLCQIFDYAEKFTFQQEMDFLAENKIDYVDYCSHRSTYSELLDGFQQAVCDPTVDLVWFVTGGTTMIQFLDEINWDLVKKSHKIFYGVSDFTHFAIKAVTLGVTCYYGQALNKIYEYFPDHPQRQFIVDFLTAGKVGDNPSLHLPLIGGQLFSTTFMIQQLNIDLSSRHLFIEHHYLVGESFNDLDYFIRQLKSVIKHNLPKSIILGHSLFYDKSYQLVDPEKVNREFINIYADLGIPISFIDHFKQIIRFSN